MINCKQKQFTNTLFNKQHMNLQPLTDRFDRSNVFILFIQIWIILVLYVMPSVNLH